jgi:predicted HTH domain antitoxin
MQTLAISVSERLLSAINLNVEEIQTAMSREYALKLYQEGKLSLSQCAELCDVDIYTFISFVSHSGVPVIDYSADDLRSELASLEAQIV